MNKYILNYIDFISRISVFSWHSLVETDITTGNPAN